MVVRLPLKQFKCRSESYLGNRKDISVVDETPGAYKNIDAVINAQSDLVEVMHTIKQVVVVKG